MTLDLRKKIVLMLLVFGLVPAAIIMGVFMFETREVERQAGEKYGDVASNIMEIIDRNLFERYGDVQAFGYNSSAYDPANWRNPSDKNPLVIAMNNYAKAYGFYPIMMLVSPAGDLLAVNSKSPAGETLDVRKFYEKNYKDEAWFKDALNGHFLNGTNGLTGTAVQPAGLNPIVAEIYGNDGFVIPFSAQVRNNEGGLIGVWVNFADFSLVEQIIGKARENMLANGMSDPDLMIFDKNGIQLVDYDPQNLDKNGKLQRDFDNVILKKNFIALNVQAAKLASEGKSGFTTEKNPDSNQINLFAYDHSRGAYDYPGLDWLIIMGADPKDVYASIYKIENQMLTLTGVSAALILVLGLWIGGAFAAPVRRLVEVVRQLADGKLHVEIPFTQKGDEIGTLAKSMEVFRDKMRETEKLREEQELTKRHNEIENKKAMNKMADDFEAAVNVVVNAVAQASSEMKTYAETLSSMADQTNQRSATVAAASEQAAANVSTVAAATEELSSSIHEITRQVADSSKTANAAVDEARSTNKTISGLAEAAQKIGDVTQLISEIANQTNLLALNATIEAARAGEAGKGFAVVASEVKNLASQTAKATEDITVQITGMQTIAVEAVKAIQGISGTIEKINGISSAIAAAVEEQGAATQEISRNVQEAAVGTKDVSTNIVGVTQSAGETGQVASQVLNAAEQLQGESNRLKVEVAKFIVRVRAA